LTVPAPDGTTFALFVAAALTLLLIPGPAVLYIVAQSIDRGRAAGLVSTLGIATGSLVHVTAAALGLSSLLVSSARAFDVVKYAGAAYLIYLGARRLLTRETPASVAARGERILRATYAQGVVVNVLNPKTALFFFAFLPQFVPAGSSGTLARMAGLSAVFMAMTFVTFAAYAVAAGALRDRVLTRPRLVTRIRKVFAASFVALSARLAVESR
jgi:threonine/homoserine/homoserine lactone efflux protein